MELFRKQPAGKETLEFDCTPRLPDSVTVSSATVAGIRLDTMATDNTVLTSTTGSVSSPYVRAQAIAGTDGVDYRIEMTVTLSNGDIIHKVWLMKVRES
jgi:hypothetical protein